MTSLVAIQKAPEKLLRRTPIVASLNEALDYKNYNNICKILTGKSPTELEDEDEGSFAFPSIYSEKKQTQFCGYDEYGRQKLTTKIIYRIEHDGMNEDAERKIIALLKKLNHNYVS